MESSIYGYSIISTCNETGLFCIVEIDRIRDAIDDKGQNKLYIGDEGEHLKKHAVTVYRMTRY